LDAVNDFGVALIACAGTRCHGHGQSPQARREDPLSRLAQCQPAMPVVTGPYGWKSGVSRGRSSL